MANLRSKSYHLDCKPIAWSRAGYSHKVGFFDTQANTKLCLGIYMQQQHGDEQPFSRPLSLDVTFYMPMPKNARRKNPPIYHPFCPDLDNLLKYLLDTLTSAQIITDDKLICSIIAKKMYTEPDQSRTFFTLTEIE